jgi:hypothetical protein
MIVHVFSTKSREFLLANFHNIEYNKNNYVLCGSNAYERFKSADLDDSAGTDGGSAAWRLHLAGSMD